MIASMRILPFFLTLPLLAAAPSMTLRNAAVTWGSGVQPKGEMPPSHFAVDVHLTGKCVPNKPQFKAWAMKAEQVAQLVKGKAIPKGLEKQLTPLDIRTTSGGVWQISGPWPGTPEPNDRLVVELRTRTRNLVWAESSVGEHLIPQGRPQTERDE